MALPIDITVTTEGGTKITLVNATWVLTDDALNLFVAPRPRFQLLLTQTICSIGKADNDPSVVNLHLSCMPQDTNVLVFNIWRQWADPSVTVSIPGTNPLKSQTASPYTGERQYTIALSAEAARAEQEKFEAMIRKIAAEPLAKKPE
jgi:hypothetical protein